MISLTLESILSAPDLPSNLPKFEIISECIKVDYDDGSRSGRASDNEDNFGSSSSGSSSESDITSEEEEVFPCECGFDENSTNFEGQACGSSANCINRELFIECNPEDCPCRSSCQNQRFQRKQYAKVKVIETPGKGFGLFVCEDLKAGKLVMEYVGEIVDGDQMNDRAKKYFSQKQAHFYFMTLKPDQIIDATCKGNVSRFMNHSCAPNCETQKWIVGGKIRIGLFALKNVKVGSELTFDYKFVRFGKEPQTCLCGEPNCTGFIGVSQKKVKKIATKKQLEVLEDDFDSSDNNDSEFDITSVTSPKHVAIIVTKLIKANDPETIKQLLQALEGTSEYLCQRKFLNLHGLKLLASIYTENSKDLEIVSSILKILSALPLNTRNAIEEAGWFEKLKDLKSDHRLAGEILEKWDKLELTFKIPKKTRNNSTNNTTPVTKTSDLLEMSGIPSEFSSALKRKRQWNTDTETDGNVGNVNDFKNDNRSPRRQLSPDRSRSPVKTTTHKIPDPMWLSAKAPDGRTYYYHSNTRETSWEVPMIESKSDCVSDGKYEGRSRHYDQRSDERNDRRGYNRNEDYVRKDYRGDDYRDSRGRSDYRDSRDHRSGNYRDDNNNRDSSRTSRDNRGSSRDNRDEILTMNPSTRQDALLEGVEDSSQLAAIIERAKARRAQESESIDSDLQSNFSKFVAIEENSPIVSSPELSKYGASKKYYAKLKEEVSGVVIRFLSHYREALGTEFKDIARKYTHKIIEKELKEPEQRKSSDDFQVLLNTKKKQKIKNYLAQVLKGRSVKLLPEHENQ